MSGSAQFYHDAALSLLPRSIDSWFNSTVAVQSRTMTNHVTSLPFIDLHNVIVHFVCRKVRKTQRMNLANDPVSCILAAEGWIYLRLKLEQ